jgi:hypothetical protein
MQVRRNGEHRTQGGIGHRYLASSSSGDDHYFASGGGDVEQGTESYYFGIN